MLEEIFILFTLRSIFVPKNLKKVKVDGNVVNVTQNSFNKDTAESSRDRIYLSTQG